ncbi:type I restriction-modification enzyme R subunit C-terminal domain-containing protein [Wohlfahrtiimonas chitiniclastica]
MSNNPFDRIGSPLKIAKMFGGIDGYNDAILALQNELYTFAEQA